MFLDSTVGRGLQKRCFDLQSQAPVGEPNGMGAAGTAEEARGLVWGEVRGGRWLHVEAAIEASSAG